MEFACNSLQSWEEGKQLKVKIEIKHLCHPRFSLFSVTLATIRELWPEFDSDEEALLFGPLPVALNRCCQQRPYCCSEKQEKQRKLPVTKQNVDCCALLFLTLQLHSKPQMTLMGGHGSGRQHIKWLLKLMENPHVQKHISTDLFLSFLYKKEHRGFYFIMCESLAKI